MFTLTMDLGELHSIKSIQSSTFPKQLLTWVLYMASIINPSVGLCNTHTFPLVSNLTVQFILSSLSGPSGVYRPGSVLKYTCEVNFVTIKGFLVVDFGITSS